MKKKKTKILLVVAIAVVLILAVNLIGAVMKASEQRAYSSTVDEPKLLGEDTGVDEEDTRVKSGMILSELLSILTKPVMSSTALITLTAGIFIAKIAREEDGSD